MVSGARSPSLGGEAFDHAIVSHLVSGFKEEHTIDLASDHLALQRLHEAAEAAKVITCEDVHSAHTHLDTLHTYTYCVATRLPR